MASLTVVNVHSNSLSRFQRMLLTFDVVSMIRDVDRLATFSKLITQLRRDAAWVRASTNVYISSKVLLLTSLTLMEWYTSAVGFKGNTWHCVVTSLDTGTWSGSKDHVIRPVMCPHFSLATESGSKDHVKFDRSRGDAIARKHVNGSHKFPLRL